MTNPQRALQVWSLLALAAMTRTVLTYEEVANLTGLPNNSGHVLGHIYFYCAQHKLPLLPALVVEKHTGKQSADLYEGMDIPEQHRRCFRQRSRRRATPTTEANLGVSWWCRARLKLNGIWLPNSPQNNSRFRLTFALALLTMQLNGDVLIR